MRGSDQTNGRGRIWAWLLLAIGMVPRAICAQDLPPSLLASRAAEPVDLAAHRITVWGSDKERYVVLEGEAAVLQGAEGVRAEKAVVRVRPLATPGPTTLYLEIYAEGRVRVTDEPGRKLPQLRMELKTIRDPTLKPYAAHGIIRAAGPQGDLKLIERAFPSARAQPQPPQPPVRPSAPPQRPAAPHASAGVPAPSPGPVVPTASLVRANEAAPADPAVKPAQFMDDGFSDAPGMPMIEEAPAPSFNPLMPALDQPPPAIPGAPPVELQPLPGDDVIDVPPPAAPNNNAGRASAAPAPILPGTQRVVGIYPRNGGPNFTVQMLPETKEGVQTLIVQGGVTLTTEDPERGTIDISADNIVIWRGPSPNKTATVTGTQIIQDAKEPLEVYLEGNVVFRQDERKVAGNGDQKTYRATRAYFDFVSQRFAALDAELDLFAPGLIAPMKIRGPRIQQYAPAFVGPDGRTTFGKVQVYADQTRSTGSRFANPGYQFFSRRVDLEQVARDLTEPSSGTTVSRPGDPNPPKDLTWQVDARQNVFYMGPVPVFFWPHLVTTPDDLDPPLRNITPRFNNYFGQQLLSDWNGFKLFGLRKPRYVQVDNWNVDIDYLSRRKSAAFGSEFGYFGQDLLSDIANDFTPGSGQLGYKRKDLFPGIDGSYFGYLDFWGLRDLATDVLGPGPAIVTNGPPGSGKAGFQRTSVPSFVNLRGRVMGRHMQSLNPEDVDPFEDNRLELEFGYLSDRNFLEEYYKRLFDTGMDQETAAYFIRQRDNWAWTLLTEANFQSWYTETQWAPKFQYYRLGDSFLGHLFNYYQDSGADWANVHTAIEVNNPTTFLFMPFDPVSNTSGPWRSGRAWTTHEIDMPINLGVIRFVPYAQGQVIGWNNQINGNSVGRVWGAVGAKANVMAWRAYPLVESELLNVHGLNHKISFDANYRDSFSNVPLNQIGVQDDLDDNTYEWVRRYFALTNYAGGLLPVQFDPRFLALRRNFSPITGTTDVQAAMNTLQLGIHQRLQTKRGPEGRRRIIDYMVLDVTSTYFPQASRDNFGKSFGQNMYNYEWYIGDRTSIYSYGWFEFFDITGQPLLKVNTNRHNNPFGMTVVSSGVSIARPPRGNITLGYSIIDTGTINTSALNAMFSYWMSPKWYAAFSTSYDFGNAVLLGSMVSITRIGADYLTTMGLSVDPQRLNSFTFGFEITPRLSPNIRLGSTAGMMRFDSRFAPTQ